MPQFQESPMPKGYEVLKQLLASSPVITEAEFKADLAHHIGVELDTVRKYTRRADKNDFTATGARDPLTRVAVIMQRGQLWAPEHVWSICQFFLDEYDRLNRAHHKTLKAWNRREGSNALLDAATTAVKSLNAQKGDESDRATYDKCLVLRGVLDQTIEALRTEMTGPVAPDKPKFNAVQATRDHFAGKRAG